MEAFLRNSPIQARLMFRDMPLEELAKIREVSRTCFQFVKEVATSQAVLLNTERRIHAFLTRLWVRKWAERSLRHASVVDLDDHLLCSRFYLYPPPARYYWPDLYAVLDVAAPSLRALFIHTEDLRRLPKKSQRVSSGLRTLVVRFKPNTDLIVDFEYSRDACLLLPPETVPRHWHVELSLFVWADVLGRDTSGLWRAPIEAPEKRAALVECSIDLMLLVDIESVCPQEITEENVSNDTLQAFKESSEELSRMSPHRSSQLGDSLDKRLRKIVASGGGAYFQQWWLQVMLICKALHIRVVVVSLGCWGFSLSKSCERSFYNTDVHSRFRSSGIVVEF